MRKLNMRCTVNSFLMVDQEEKEDRETQGQTEREKERELWWGSALCSRPCLALGPTLQHWSLSAPSKIVSLSHTHKRPTWSVKLQVGNTPEERLIRFCVKFKVHATFLPWFAYI